ncbi:hypothetical protein [Glacieibacterium sp.]|uniref:hypothetical protein n=1 Tax=Glacieibacterium sp. TaxID=2860237 RepID=UPI003B003FBF
MRVGPLRFLALFGTAAFALGASRIPDLATGMKTDMAAASEDPTDLSAAASSDEALPHRIVLQPWHQHQALPLVIRLREPARLPERRPPPRVRLVAAVPTRAALAITQPQLPWNDVAVFTDSAGPDATRLAAAPQDSWVFTPPPASEQPGFSSQQFATAAYGQLKSGNRRAAARAFEKALGETPDDTNAPAWRSQLALMRRRWSGEVYLLGREQGPNGLGVAPLLGGGQAGSTLSFTPDPLARQPFSVTLRTAIPLRGDGLGTGFEGHGAQVALGARWQALPWMALSAERLVAVGSQGRDAWTLRAAGGGSHKVGRLLVDGYAEAGVVGASRRDVYASVQARAVVPIPIASGWTLQPGVGLWSSVQRAGGQTLDRVDVGPTVSLQLPHATLSLDYRYRVTGNVRPDSGVALTLSARF